MFVYPLFRPSHCPTDEYTTVTHVVCVYTIPPKGENHINRDVSILVVIFREIFKVAKFE
mgnify:CR=1 FL=1